MFSCCKIHEYNIHNKKNIKGNDEAFYPFVKIRQDLNKRSWIWFLDRKKSGTKKKSDNRELTDLTGIICPDVFKKIGIRMNEYHHDNRDSSNIIKFRKSFSHIQTVCQKSRRLPTHFGEV